MSHPASYPDPQPSRLLPDPEPPSFAEQLDAHLEWLLDRQQSVTPASGRRLLQALKDLRHQLTGQDAMCAAMFTHMVAPTPPLAARLHSDVDGLRGTLILNRDRVRWLRGGQCSDYVQGLVGLRAIQDDGAYSVS